MPRETGPIPGTNSARFPLAPNMPRLGRLGHAPRSVQVRSRGGQFAHGFGVNWIGLHEVERLFEVASDIPQRTPEIMRQIGEQAIQWAKENARWEDQTGTARGLGARNDDPAHLHYAVVTENNGTASLHLAHGPEYGVYLEANPETAILAEALLHASGIATQVADAEITRLLGKAGGR